MPSKKKGPKKLSKKDTSQDSAGDRTKAQLDKIRSKGIFETAKKGELFGSHPGYVDLRIRLSVYNSVTQQEEKLPGKELGLLVSSIDEVDDMVKVITESLTAWAAGLYVPRR